LTPLYSGALVWNFLPAYYAKINYATGFRPPVFQNTQAAPGGLEYGGSPNLKTESSQSLQGELNARLLTHLRGVRALDLRLDYSYTVLSNLITVQAGSYTNAGKQAIHSVESYAKLYLSGEHLVTASYTFLFAVSTDKGVLRSRPHHWLSLGAVFKL